MNKEDPYRAFTAADGDRNNKLNKYIICSKVIRAKKKGDVEQGRSMILKRIVVLNRMVRVSLIENATFGQRLEGYKGVNAADLEGLCVARQR